MPTTYMCSCPAKAGHASYTKRYLQ